MKNPQSPNFIDESPTLFNRPQAFITQHISQQYENPLQARLLMDTYLENLATELKYCEMIDLYCILIKLEKEIVEKFGQDDPDVMDIQAMREEIANDEIDFRTFLYAALKKIFFKLTKQGPDITGNQTHIAKAMATLNKIITEHPEDQKIRQAVEKTIEECQEAALRRVKRIMRAWQAKQFKGEH